MLVARFVDEGRYLAHPGWAERPLRHGSASGEPSGYGNSWVYLLSAQFASVPAPAVADTVTDFGGTPLSLWQSTVKIVAKPALSVMGVGVPTWTLFAHSGPARRSCSPPPRPMLFEGTVEGGVWIGCDGCVR